MSNYPLGAENDPRAPYNQEPKRVKRTVGVSITLSADIEVEIPENALDPIQAAKDYIADYVELPGEFLVDWCVDDYEICL